MIRFFNTAGPVNPQDHYTLPPLSRLDLEELLLLIAQKKYFVLHAPRQTGKTSLLLALMEYLNNGKEYTCLYANIETAQTARGDVEQGIFEVARAIAASANIYLGDERLYQWLCEEKEKRNGHGLLDALLTRWSQESAKPVILFLDEVDALVGDTLISVLRQLRKGYNQRPAAFPQSLILCGVRDVKDYRIQQGDGEVITGGSAFNVKAESLRMGNFTREEINTLYQQHTQETGQAFAQEIFPQVWLDTQGQPWLVNALAYEMAWKDKAARDRTRDIGLEQYQAARERLIQSRATHLDQLADKLQEDRVRRTIAPLLASDATAFQVPTDDLQYLEDLGLIQRKPQVRIANRIYQEIIPRELTASTQDTIVEQQEWYVDTENRLDMHKLLAAFQQFFREHAESWIERFEYKEAGPQLLLQAFLQRIINSGGRISREYGLGRKRTDLVIEWPLDKEQGYFGPVQRIVIELKILRGNLDTLIEQGMNQVAEYSDTFNADEAHLVLFDRGPEIAWEAKIWQQSRQHGSRQIAIWGC
ncbi:AAA-like domain-containing protein [Candidatus Electrothrix sp.]|uniref:AAA-like domain-containing protein n=1 Tax=Candidatus Electrothrix sp. TaxID=2170559 RepID=UPI00405651E0